MASRPSSAVIQLRDEAAKDHSVGNETEQQEDHERSLREATAGWWIRIFEDAKRKFHEFTSHAPKETSADRSACITKNSTVAMVPNWRANREAE